MQYNPTRTTRLLWISALMLSFHASLSAEEDVWKSIFGGTTNVNIVNVEVIVTSKDGHPVTDLRQSDFILLEDGEPVEISNFFAVTNGRAIPLASESDPVVNDQATAENEAGELTPIDQEVVGDRQPHHVIMFIDNVNLATANRNHAIADLRKFLLDRTELGARVMLMTNDRSLVVRQEFTSIPHDIMVALDEVEHTAAASPRFDLDRRTIIRAIEAVNVEAGSGLFATKDYAGQALTANSDGDQEQNDITNRTVAEARAVLAQIEAYASQRLQHTRSSFQIIDHLIGTAAGFPGRKTILYVSDGLSLKPGEALFEAYTRRFSALADVGARVHGDARTARDDATPELRKLLDHANASGVTFYSLDASPPERLAYGSAESTSYGGGNFAAWNDSFASMEENNDQQSIRLLAQETGGLFSPSRSSFDFLMNSLVSDFGNYYSLGFAAIRDPESDNRRLEVKIKGDNNYSIRHRDSFRQLSLGERSAERARAALLVDQTENSFDIRVDTKEPLPQEDGTFLVPVSVSIPLAKLVLLPGETDHQGKISMFVTVRDERGRTSDVNQHLCPIRIPNDDVLTALGHRAGCGVRLKMRPGKQRIAVSILDELSAIDSTSFVHVDIAAPTVADGEI